MDGTPYLRKVDGATTSSSRSSTPCSTAVPPSGSWTGTASGNTPCSTPPPRTRLGSGPHRPSHHRIRRPKHVQSAPAGSGVQDHALRRIRRPWTGSKKQELKSKQKLEKKLSFYTKVKDTVTSLNAKKAISKKKKQRSSQKKLKAYDLSALSEFLQETAALSQKTEVKLNCKSKQALVQRESAQLNAVLNNPQFQLDPFAAIHQHLLSMQPPSSAKDDKSLKHGKKSTKDKRKKKKKNSSSTSQPMDI